MIENIGKLYIYFKTILALFLKLIINKDEIMKRED